MDIKEMTNEELNNELIIRSQTFEDCTDIIQEKINRYVYLSAPPVTLFVNNTIKLK